MSKFSMNFFENLFQFLFFSNYSRPDWDSVRVQDQQQKKKRNIYFFKQKNNLNGGLFSTANGTQFSRGKKKNKKKTRENRVTATSFFIRIFVIFLYHTFIPSPFSLLKKNISSSMRSEWFFFQISSQLPGDTLLRYKFTHVRLSVSKMDGFFGLKWNVT